MVRNQDGPGKRGGAIREVEKRIRARTRSCLHRGKKKGKVRPKRPKSIRGVEGELPEVMPTTAGDDLLREEPRVEEFPPRKKDSGAVTQGVGTAKKPAGHPSQKKRPASRVRAPRQTSR